MAFHPDFWVAVATAEPVIGLALVVVLERVSGRGTASFVAKTMLLVAVFSCILGLVIALDCLAHDSDEGAINLATGSVLVPFCLLAGIAALRELGQRPWTRK